MPEFLALLANLYLCDAITEIRHLTMPETTECAQAEDLVHAYFISFEPAAPGTPDHVIQTTNATHALAAWEAANPHLVADMQAAAWLSVRRTGAVLFW